MNEPGGDDSIYAKLAEIAGGVRVIDTKLDATNKVNDERHHRTVADIKDLQMTSSNHGTALQTLFGWKSNVEGERKGLSNAGRIAWAGIGSILGGGGIAALMRLLGS